MVRTYLLPLDVKDRGPTRSILIFSSAFMSVSVILKNRLMSFYPNDFTELTISTSLDIVGYIESVEPLTSVKTYQTWIYKIILNNSKGMKVPVVFWKDKALEWSSKLTLSQLHVQDFSTIQVLGKFDLVHAQQNEMQFQETTIEQCLVHGRTPIAIGGYVKNDFVILKTIGQMSMANGNIADGRFRLCVQIRDYKSS
ncbi:uncharacterized protein LOC135172055 isoform X3 [Diachasmimorpha longicaudata]|uniref:uncharacterized protein LOC135172055 isoform X3 n=1 Tax=Diachasmimorpha longicaudata TaxID=58733 RepID=UPI0030B8858B